MRQITGLTNALTDIVFEVERADLRRLNLKEGSHNYSDNGLRDRVERCLTGRAKKVFYAGSAANTMFNLSALGLNTGLIASVGNDSVGQDYIKYLKASGVTPHVSVRKGKSGVCYVLVSESRERTWVVDLGVSADFKARRDVDFGRVFHTTLFDYNSNPAETIKMIRDAKKQGAIISLDLSDKRAIKGRVDEVRKVLNDVDVVFSSDSEAKALTGLDYEDALDLMKSNHEIVAMKLGGRGAILARGSSKVRLPALDIKVENTNGAGDAYASGVLYGYVKGMNIREMAEKGREIAARVCSTVSSHL